MAPSGERVDTSGETVEADRRDADREHEPDREPTAEEERAAERRGEGADPEVADAYEEAMERGANVKGEGQID
jgi:hypothetical protein